MLKVTRQITLLVVVTLILISCVATKDSPVGKQVGEPLYNALRVGVTPDSPPMIFTLNGKMTGVEADLAQGLGKELNRPIQFVNLEWEQLIPALLEGKIDIIMSGMTITEARKVRIMFTDYYLKSGLMSAMRAEDAAKYNSLQSLTEGYLSVGVIAGTTGEAYVRKNFKKVTRIIALPNTSYAANELRSRRVDIFVHDAPFIAWLVSENEAKIKGFWEPLNVEYIGWGVRRDDQEFLIRVNTIIRKWRQDGTLKEILSRWLPYWKDFS